MPEFTAWLASMSADELAVVLARRPDAVRTPVPRGVREVALRLAHPYSVAAALAELPAPVVQLAEVVAALGERCPPAEAAALVGREADDPDVARALAMLTDAALVWPDGDQLRLVGSAWDYPLRLGPTVARLLAELPATTAHGIAEALGLGGGRRKNDTIAAIAELFADGEAVRDLVAAAPARQRRMLAELAATGPVSARPMMYGGSSDDWALGHGLLIALGSPWSATLVLPREVAIALRGNGWRPPFEPVRPAPPTVAVPVDAVERDAAAAAAHAVRQVTAVLDACSAEPVRPRKDGVVGVRELRRLAKATGDGEPEVEFWLRLAAAAGLLAEGESGRLAPTERYDAWRSAEPADALVDLLAALPLPDDAAAGLLYSAVLDVAGGLPPDRGADPADIVPAVCWLRPLLCAQLDDVPEAVAAAWREAELVGLVARGTASPLGRAVCTPDLSAVAARLMPEAQTHARFQADLTAVVAGPPAGTVADLLDAVAERESRGAASTWRFSPASVRAALDAGLAADPLLDQLRAIAVDGALPQPLEYLVADVARQHGRIVAVAAACCLRGDEALLAEIASTRSLGRLGLTVLAPTVLASRRPLAETLDALRAAGYAPVAEDGEAAPAITRVATEPPAEPEPVDLVALAADLLAAPEDQPDESATLDAVQARAPQLGEAEQRLLSAAIDTGSPIFIEYVNAAGNASRRVLTNLELDGGMLYAYCTLREDDRSFTLARIRTVAPA